MSSYKKYISLGVSIIVLPLAKTALSKLININAENSKQDAITRETEKRMPAYQSFERV